MNVKNKIDKVKWIDEEGEITPSQSTQSQAKVFIADFYRNVITNSFQWKNPLTNASPNKEIVFEWWNEQKKLTVYCKKNSLEFIKIWGTDIDSEMDNGVISANNITELAKWIFN